MYLYLDICLQRIREVGKQVGIKPLIIQGEELDKKGFGGIIIVISKRGGLKIVFTHISV